MARGINSGSLGDSLKSFLLVVMGISFGSATNWIAQGTGLSSQAALAMGYGWLAFGVGAVFAWGVMLFRRT